MPIYRLTTTDAEFANSIGRREDPGQWSLYRRDYSEGYAHAVAIVRAGDPDEARLVASTNSGVENFRSWLDKSTTVEELTAGPSELLGTL